MEETEIKQINWVSDSITGRKRKRGARDVLFQIGGIPIRCHLNRDLQAVRSEPGLGARTPGPLKALCGAQPGEVTLLLDPLLPHVKYENGRSYELYLLGFLNGQADGKHSDFPTLIL